MSERLAFDHLVQTLHHGFDSLPDYRQGKNTQYAIKDAALGAFAVFCTQSPSFLASPRTMPQAKGRSHAASLFGMAQIPCDHHIRTRLDPVEPAQLFPILHVVSQALERAGQVSACRTCADQRLIAFEGTEYCSSQQLGCDNCSQRTPRNGRVTSLHQVMTPVLVAPGPAEVIALEPEFIAPQDGHQQQDCEQVAAQRWIERNARCYPQATILGEDLSCPQPCCDLLRSHGCHFILVCKPESHPTL